MRSVGGSMGGSVVLLLSHARLQDDLCLWNLTVRETITFAAKLRLPQSTPDEEKKARITELIALLGLSHVADGIIGKEGKRGISGGERKRVSIGVELITSPNVLFLDEPTSGLGERRTNVCSQKSKQQTSRPCFDDHGAMWSKLFGR